MICPELREGDIVILDNPFTHKTASITALISAHSASVRYLPAYSPDFNPIELAFAKHKSHLRQAAGRILDELPCVRPRPPHLQPPALPGFFRLARYAST
jgi:transposase